MSPRKQQIAIATACGWTADSWCLTPSGWVFADAVPDYLNDKNAMHEAKQVLWDKGLMLEFVNLLVVITCYAKGISWSKVTTDDRQMLIANATAEQEAEAFLKVLRLWEEEQIPEPSFHDYCKEDAQ